mmetsp:Transcript_32977/g.98156  ORF Transcript_32977/g.98156 Transcript_32977/m.98156 type:complete len:97 (+) Transcript_32977:63-353(+)
MCQNSKASRLKGTIEHKITKYISGPTELLKNARVSFFVVSTEMTADTQPVKMECHELVAHCHDGAIKRESKLRVVAATGANNRELPRGGETKHVYY